MVDVVGFEPTAFRLRAEYSDPVELHIHKKLYLILRTNYNHLTTLYAPVNNVLKKMVAQVRLELTTRSSSDFCSTLELLSH